MTMISDLLNGLLGPSTLVDSSYWTLAIEIVFYAQITLFVFVFGYKHLQYFFASLLAISFVVFLTHLNEYQFATLLLARHAAYFVFGGTLALVASAEKSSTIQRYLTLFLLVFSAAYATLIATRSLPAYQAVNVQDSAIITVIHIAIFTMIPLAVFLSRYVTSQKIISLLAIFGAITYPLYLVHQRVGNILIDYVIKHSTMRWLSVVIVVQIAMLVAAYALFVVDAYFQRYVRQQSKPKTLPSKDPTLPIPAFQPITGTVI
jgi:peptidoglycan/LPS O-acetylase OafA/YrhL